MIIYILCSPKPVLIVILEIQKIYKPESKSQVQTLNPYGSDPVGNSNQSVRKVFQVIPVGQQEEEHMVVHYVQGEHYQRHS